MRRLKTYEMGMCVLTAFRTRTGDRSLDDQTAALQAIVRSALWRRGITPPLPVRPARLAHPGLRLHPGRSPYASSTYGNQASSDSRGSPRNRKERQVETELLSGL